MLPTSLEFFLRLSASFPLAFIFYVVSIIDEINQFIGYDYEECNTEELIFFSSENTSYSEMMAIIFRD